MDEGYVGLYDRNGDENIDMRISNSVSLKDPIALYPLFAWPGSNGKRNECAHLSDRVICLIRKCLAA